MTPRIAPTPILDSLIGQVSSEKTFDKDPLSYSITAEVAGHNFVGNINMNAAQSVDQAFVRELARPGFADFFVHAVTGVKDIGQKDWEKYVIQHPWRPTITPKGRKIDFMPMTVAKAFVATRLIVRMLSRAQFIALGDECGATIAATNDDGAHVAEIRSEG